MGLFPPMTNVFEVAHWYSLYCSQPCYQAFLFFSPDHVSSDPPFSRPTAMSFLLSFEAALPSIRIVPYKNTAVDHVISALTFKSIAPSHQHLKDISAALNIPGSVPGLNIKQTKVGDFHIHVVGSHIIKKTYPTTAEWNGKIWKMEWKICIL